ncbi:MULTISPECIES: hypothetical protein [Kribbella]
MLEVRERPPNTAAPQPADVPEQRARTALPQVPVVPEQPQVLVARRRVA